MAKDMAINRSMEDEFTGDEARMAVDELEEELMDRWLCEDVEHLPEDFNSHLPHNFAPQRVLLESYPLHEE